jgi:hypothetical protein
MIPILSHILKMGASGWIGLCFVGMGDLKMLEMSLYD